MAISGKKIAVIGVGAIGGSLGGFMALNGEDVTLIDPWRENVDKMRSDGLLLDGSVGEHRAEVTALHTDDVGDLHARNEKFDVVIVAVKSYDTRWATELMLPFMKEDTWVVSPQNGINELQIAPIVGTRRMLGCVSTISANMMEPGHVNRTQSVSQSIQARPVCFKVGELDGSVTSRVQELAEMVQPAGECIVTEDLWAERWTKLTINCMANPTASMTGLTNYSMRTDDDTRHLMLKFGVEAMRVGRALGHDVKSPVANFDLEDIERASNGPHPEFEAVFVGKPPASPGRPSMAQDVIKGRKTEIDYLNGFAVQEGKRIGMPSPYNEAVTAVIKGIESGEFPVGTDNVDRVVSMVRATASR